jgi:hypothetical protein
MSPGRTPATEVVPIDYSFSPPLLSQACGFPVTRSVEGTLTIRTFHDTQGNFVREIDQYNLTETLSANAKTLVAHTIQSIDVTTHADGTYTVAFVGTDFRLPVPGSGISFGSAGRMLLLFSADDTLLDVTQDVGNTQGDFAAICAALT